MNRVLLVICDVKNVLMGTWCSNFIAKSRSGLVLTNGSDVLAQCGSGCSISTCAFMCSC